MLLWLSKGFEQKFGLNDVCLREQIPFWELRTISNTVGEPFGQWNIPLATDALARAIGRLLQTAENTYRTARPSDDT